MNLSIFKAYDVRGVYPEEINELDAYKIGWAFCEFLNPTELVIGADVRLSSPALKRAAMKAVTDHGVRVIDVGTISTDMLYFSVAHYGYAGGFSITASHNPKEYNGAKFVRENSIPISSDTGLFDIQDIAAKLEFDDSVLNDEPNQDLIESKDILAEYVVKVRSFANFSKIKPLKIVANPNFGVAGRALEKVLEGTDVEIIKINFEPDGNFPKGRPDPLIPENRTEISNRVIIDGANLGVAWDADADRCFFFTEKGEFIEGYFITALLAKLFLEKFPHSSILHDPRLVWAIDEIVTTNGGKTISNKSGHAFIKDRMRKEDTVFGGEMSAHYYFRDYFYCDNGMIPLVMMLEFVSQSEKTLSEIMHEMFWNKYFTPGEINSQVTNVAETIEKVKNIYFTDDAQLDTTDGISIEYPNWRFNLRGSNTEPVIRLNLEAKNQELMEQKKEELLALIRS